MERPNESHAGDYGWAGVTAGVILWDTLAPETLSHAVDRYLEHPVGRVLAVGAIAITSGHLLNLFEKYNIPDPIQETANFVSGSIRKAIKGSHGRRANRNTDIS